MVSLTLSIYILPTPPMLFFLLFMILLFTTSSPSCWVTQYCWISMYIERRKILFLDKETWKICGRILERLWMCNKLGLIRLQKIQQTFKINQTISLTFSIDQALIMNSSKRYSIIFNSDISSIRYIAKIFFERIFYI